MQNIPERFKNVKKMSFSYLTALAEWTKLQLLAFSSGVLRSEIDSVCSLFTFTLTLTVILHISSIALRLRLYGSALLKVSAGVPASKSPPA